MAGALSCFGVVMGNRTVTGLDKTISNAKSNFLYRKEQVFHKVLHIVHRVFHMRPVEKVGMIPPYKINIMLKAARFDRGSDFTAV